MNTFQVNLYGGWKKDLEDGSIAIGRVNRNTATHTIKASWDVLELSEKWVVGDVWTQNDEGRFEGSFSASVPAHELN